MSYNKYLHDVMNNWFLGCPSMQYHVDHFLWEMFFVQYGPKFTTFIELGTGQGGFSLYLCLLCIQRNKSFDTFDINEPQIFWTPVSKLVDLEAKFHKLNVFDEQEIVLEYFKSPMVLFCDNGNKKREVREFAPKLKSGDYLVVHDWGTEFLEENVPDNVEAIYTDICKSIQSRTRFFKVVE